MTKRTVRALLMALVMVIMLIGAPGMASAAGTVITVAADKTEAEPGDTINLSIILGPVSEMGTMQMVIVIPNGLTYEEGSGALAENLKNTLGYDLLGFTEGSMMVNGVASKADYASEEDTLLCTFQCTVNEGFHGTAEVGLTKLEFYSCRSWKNHTSEYSVQPALITVAGGEIEPPVTPTTTAEEATEESTAPSETTKPDETTKAEETTQPEETTKQSEAETSKEQPDTETSREQPEPATSSESGVKSSETTKDQTPSETTRSTEPAPPPESRSSSEATKSGEDATEKTSEGESKETEEGRTAPENTDQADSSKAEESTEEQRSAEAESTGSEADTKENTDKSGTTSAESDKNKESDPSDDEDSTRKSGWIWLAAVVMAIIAGTFFVIFLARKKRTENVTERGRSRKKVK